MEEYIDDFIDKFRSDDRILELSSFAERYRLFFVKRERFGNQDYRLNGFNIFKGKKGKRIRGIISDPEPTLNCEGRIYDYHYYGDGGVKKTTLIEIKSRELNLPYFILKPKKGLYRMKDMFAPSRPLISHQYFNENFVIETNDERWVQDNLDEEIIDLVLSRPKITIEGDRNYLLVYYKNKKIKIDQLIKEYEFALDIYNAMDSLGDRFV